jgi:hypothetical protein
MSPTFVQNGPTEALAWALLYFIWQAAVVGLLLKLTLLGLRRASSQARYLVNCAALALLCLCPLLTYLAERGAFRPTPDPLLSQAALAKPVMNCTDGHAIGTPEISVGTSR